MFGAEEFQLAADRAAELAAGTVPLGIGAGSSIVKAIIDKNARIGRGVKLLNVHALREAGEGRGGLPPGVVIRGGVVVVKRDAVIPDGTVV